MKNTQRILWLVIVTLFYANFLSAQQKTIDSLNDLLTKQTSDKEKGRINIKIAKEYISFDTISAKAYLKKGLDLANKTDDDLSRGMYELYNAYLLCNRGFYKDGLHGFTRASGFFNNFNSGKNLSEEEKGETVAMLLDADLSCGNVYLELYEYEKAVDVFWEVLKLLEQSSFPEKDAVTASTYQSIALAYYHREQYQTALQYYLKAVPFAEKSGDERMGAENKIYAAMCYTLVEKFDSSALLLQKAEPVVLESKDAGLKTSFYARKAELSRFTGQWQPAVEYYDKAIQNSAITSNVYLQASFLHARARCLLKLDKISEARESGLKGLELAKSIDKKREILEAQKVLSMIEANAGNYAVAYNYLDQFNLGDDSLHTAELTEKIQALDKKYQSALKEEKINQLEKDKKIQELINRKRKATNFLLAALLMILLVLGVLGIRNYKQRQTLQLKRINQLEIEKHLLATEAVLKGEEQERTRLAKDLHDGLGGMLSGIKYSLNTMKENLIMTPDNAQAFERSIDMLDSSIQEMRRVAHNLMPENLLKFGLDTAIRDFCSAIYGTGILNLKYQSYGFENESFDQSVSISVYRIIQELVTNIVKHANAGTAHVQLSYSNKTLLIDVEDDGKGFKVANLKSQKGIGWSNIKSRLEYLNGELDIQSQPNKGTAIHIELKI